ncbi:helix-turn-helix domain-containing protein [Nonomuraea insulae]|uniref:Helix-turn-helix domain-containing protein n=1 Tax=Nonomuraea insulae TaxID=1616787 RepID=A0ABW1CY84_9ACTN
MAERVRVREIDDDEGNRLLRIVRRGSGSVVTWRRAQMVLWSAQGMTAQKIAELAFTSEDRVRDVIHNFNADGFGSLYPKYKGRRQPKFTLPQRVEIKKIAKSKPAEHGLPFSRRPASSICTRSLTVRSSPTTANPRSSSVWTSSGRSTCNRARASSGPTSAERTRTPSASPGRGCAPPTPAPRAYATYSPPWIWARNKMYGHIKNRKRRGEFLEFCRYLRSLYPPEIRIAIICDNFSPHLTTKKDNRVGQWAEVNNVEIAYTPTNSSWLNRIEAQFTALREFTLNGTDHDSHREQGSMIRRYIAWRNRHTNDERLRRIVKKANVA